MSKIAMCPRCDDTPLVMTFLWRAREFYCLDCGGTFEFLSPRPAKETPALLARLQAYESEFEALSDGAYPEHSWLESCVQCKAGEYHSLHATPEQRQACLDAAERLRTRVKVGAL